MSGDGPRTAQLDLALWVAFGIVAVVAGIVGVMMLVAPGSTDDYFSWPAGPEPLAATVGGFYVASTVTFGLAIRRPWGEVRGLVAAVLALTLPTLVATLIHSEVFDFSRVIAIIWLLLFVGSPLTYGTILWLRRDEDVPDSPQLPVAVRTGFLVLGGVFVVFTLLCWFEDGVANDLVPFTMAPMSAAFLGAWSLFLATLCFAVRTVDGSRIPLVGLVTYPVGAVVAGLTTYGDMDGARWAWLLVWAAIAVAAAASLRASR